MTKQELLKMIEDHLKEFNEKELLDFGKDLNELIKEMTNPSYRRKKEAEQEYEKILAELPHEQAEQMRKTIEQYIQSQVEPKPEKTRYNIDGKIIEYSGKGRNNEIYAYLSKQGWNPNEKNAKNKKESKDALLEKVRVKE